MNNFFDTYNKKDCNGCSVCALRCPIKCIDMIEDNEGFLYPKIDEKRCIKCGICKKVCPNYTPKISLKGDTYIAINNNTNEKRRSSSGGMFYPLARYAISKGGVVFGVTFNEELKAVHDYAENLEDAKKFQGSKYVRSNLNNSYQRVEQFVKNGKLVLFTGTPCQCQGIRGYLKNGHDNLITCEIVCHANPSPKIFEMYKKNIEEKYSKKIKNIYFRSKENGWHNQTPIIEFMDGQKIEENSYFIAFVHELINRPSCYDCRFCTEKRFSDFSIADLWGIEKIDNSVVDDDTGISLFNVNTDRGREILEEIKKEIRLKKVDTNLAFSYNHHFNIPYHKNRTRFFYEISNNKIDEHNIIKKMNKYTKKPLYKKIHNRIKEIIK
ncbi:Coenzyme F420 hydrogenase/dehydrogenase, beta subunit C-terminal domain [Clostridium baratii]|uniref:Coenzyme F420 hydrogenase/dehydrogenase, beta subunit C-terminal domain n=1 Tax=Clostridium baratii TaxID=1561 RepID=UPI001C02B572|nr:Coenzyme F420 hydrogenase/dehydrogenase, beta subunit C-terminal domain [Clostridium baratii]MBT9830468.1 4Fe-4S dicluster domain-containing protein [Clostridium baratii]MDY3207555.1 Coenzyme F420 hydrogenase/dehydrogenase, beta subunit C-terminal domain [Clostridium baratii]